VIFRGTVRQADADGPGLSRFEQDFVVDVDDSLGRPPERLRIKVDQENLEYYGVQEQALFDTLDALIGGWPEVLLKAKHDPGDV